jgi:hypothetical protein
VSEAIAAADLDLIFDPAVRFIALRADSHSLLQRATRSVATLGAVIADSRMLLRRAAVLCGMALPIRGGSTDVDGSLILETIERAPMCIGCVSKKTGIPEQRAMGSLARLQQSRSIEVASGPCAGCLTLEKTYRVVARRGHGNGAVMQAPVVPAVVTQSAALWSFLAAHRGQMFCTQCIAKSLSASKRIDRAVIGAEGRGARRHYGTCASCGRERLLCGLPTT